MAGDDRPYFARSVEVSDTVPVVFALPMPVKRAVTASASAIAAEGLLNFQSVLSFAAAISPDLFLSVKDVTLSLVKCNTVRSRKASRDLSALTSRDSGSNATLF